jgi:hypothetical protein
MNKRTINQAIKHLGVEIQNNRDGYSYFTGLVEGHQIGQSVYICYLNMLTLAEWVERAADAVAEDAALGEDRMIDWTARHPFNPSVYNFSK